MLLKVGTVFVCPFATKDLANSSIDTVLLFREATFDLYFEGGLENHPKLYCIFKAKYFSSEAKGKQLPI